jgi:1,4-dihydroxy-2-naphthoate octaprenyltransferase
LALAYWLERPWVGFLGVVIGLVYAVGLFWFGSHLAGDMLLKREAEVVEALRLPEHQD